MTGGKKELDDTLDMVELVDTIECSSVVLTLLFWSSRVLVAFCRPSPPPPPLLLLIFGLDARRTRRVAIVAVMAVAVGGCEGATLPWRVVLRGLGACWTRLPDRC